MRADKVGPEHRHPAPTSVSEMTRYGGTNSSIPTSIHCHRDALKGIARSRQRLRATVGRSGARDEFVLAAARRPPAHTESLPAAAARLLQVGIGPGGRSSALKPTAAIPPSAQAHPQTSPSCSPQEPSPVPARRSRIRARSTRPVAHESHRRFVSQDVVVLARRERAGRADVGERHPRQPLDAVRPVVAGHHQPADSRARASGLIARPATTARARPSAMEPLVVRADTRVRRSGGSRFREGPPAPFCSAHTRERHGYEISQHRLAGGKTLDYLGLEAQPFFVNSSG